MYWKYQAIGAYKLLVYIFDFLQFCRPLDYHFILFFTFYMFCKKCKLTF